MTYYYPWKLWQNQFAGPGKPDPADVPGTQFHGFNVWLMDDEEEPTTEEPTTEEPTTEEPTTQEPTTQEPTTEEPTTEDPTTPDPNTTTTEEPTTEEPTTQEPTTEEPIAPGRRVQGAMDQHHGGTNYPFIDPSQQIEYLIDDAFLYFDAPACAFRPPLAIATLYGFGTEPAPAASWEHEYDVVIQDQDGKTVFNSSQPEVIFRKENFGEDKRVLEWVHPAENTILRLVIFNGWDPHQTPLTWPRWFHVERGELSPRTLQRRISEIDQLRVVTDLADPSQDIVLDTGDVIFRPGYNLALETEPSPDRVTRPLIRFHADAGAGKGRYPGCEVETYVRRLNGVSADSSGNLRLLDTDCVRVNLPLASEPDNGGIYAGDMRQVAITPHTLMTDSDCGVCADCDDFIRVYEAIRRVFDRYRELGSRAEAVRDQYKLNKERWEANRACRAGSQLRIAMQPLSPCLIAVGIGVCNQTDENLTNFGLDLEFTSSHDEGCVICESVFRRGNVKVDGPPPAQSVLYKLTGDWPNYTAMFDCVSPGSTGYIGFHMRFHGCAAGQQVTLKLNGSNSEVSFPQVSQTASLIASRDTIDCCEVIEPTTTTAEP